MEPTPKPLLNHTFGANAVSFLGFIQACGNQTTLSKISKLAFEYIWGPEIESGVFNLGEYFKFYNLKRIKIKFNNYFFLNFQINFIHQDAF